MRRKLIESLIPVTAVWLLASTVALAGDQLGGLSAPALEALPQQLIKRLNTAQDEPSRETADQILIYDREVRWTRYLRSALQAPEWLEIGVEQRTRFESFDHPFRKGEYGTDSQIPQRSRLRLGIDGPGPFRFLAEFQDSRTHLEQPGDFVNNEVVDTTDVLQVFVSATVPNLLGSGLRSDLHVGRLTMDFGHRRYIARNNYRNTTNSFNGIHWQLSREKHWLIRSFFVAPTILRQERPDTFATDFLFWGVAYENQEISWLQTSIYYFGLNDRESSDSNSHRRFSTFGFRIYRNPHEGRLDYEIETAFQTGRKGSKEHFAYNPHAELGYTFRLPWTPRLLIQYDYASGTSNPNGSQDGTFDKLFGARNFDLIPTGIYGPFNRSNISSPGIRLLVWPNPSLRLQLKFRAWYLAQARDAFSDSGLQDPSGRAGNYLGEDLSLRARWNMNQNLQFEAVYDHWFKGSFFDRIAAEQPDLNLSTADTDYFGILTKVRF